jgi:hypothetical protein
MLYQCNIDGKTALRFATVVVRKSNETNVDPQFDMDTISSSIQNLTGHIEVAVPILDVEVYDYCVNSSTFKILMTVTMNGTYQNILFFYDAHYNKTAKRLTTSIENDAFMSSYTTNMDTFKV